MARFASDHGCLTRHAHANTHQNPKSIPSSNGRASSAPDADCGGMGMGLNWQLSASGASCDDACSLVGESCVAIADWPSEARTFDCMGSVAQENGKACDSNGDGFWEHRPSINAILSGDDCAKNSGSPVTTRRR